jgi:hypothetical protein
MIGEEGAAGGSQSQDDGKGTPAAEGKSILNAGGEQGVQDAKADDKGSKQDDTLGWRSGLPKELQDLPEIKRYKTLDDFAKGHVEQSKFVGKSIQVPDEKADQKTWDAFYTKLGRPEKPEGYKFNIPAGAEKYADKEAQATFSKLAHSVGMTQKQIDAVVKYQGERIMQSKETIGGNYAETVKELKEAYGGAYDRNLGIAQRFVREVGGKDLIDYLDATGLGNHPALVKAFVKAGTLLVEDGVINDDIEGQVGPSAAKDEIAEIMGNRQHAYWNTGDPGHADAVRRMKQLHDIAFPE